MNKRNVAHTILTVLVVLLFVFLGKYLTKDEFYSGTDIRFYTGREIVIDAPSVTFEAVSGQFFALYNEKGGAIAGTPTEKPFGWGEKQYFTYGPQEVPGGKWLFKVGIAAVRITSDAGTTVRIYHDPVSPWLLCFLIAIVIWIVGFFIGDYLFK